MNSRSILTREFAIQDAAFANVEAEKDFDKVFNVIRQSRSLAAQYNVQSNIQCASITKCFSIRIYLTLIKQYSSLRLPLKKP